MPRRFFCSERKKLRKWHTIHSKKQNSGGRKKNYNYLQKEKLCLGFLNFQSFNFFEAAQWRETLFFLKIEATEGIFSCLCDFLFLFLLKFMFC